VNVRVHPAGGKEIRDVWPLATLVAFLFDGRECDDVRSLLTKGEGSAHDTRAHWEPISLTADELSAIERGFPAPDPSRVLVPEELAAAQIAVPAASPREMAPARVDHPLVREAVARALYVRFDYGEWADVFTASLTRDQALALLADTMLGVRDSDLVEPAARLAEEDTAALRLIAPRPGVRPPWSGGLAPGKGGP